MIEPTLTSLCLTEKNRFLGSRFSIFNLKPEYMLLALKDEVLSGNREKTTTQNPLFFLSTSENLFWTSFFSNIRIR